MWSKRGITITREILQYYEGYMLEFYFVHHKSQISKTDLRCHSGLIICFVD